MSLHGAIDVVVSDVVVLNELIKRFHFRRPDGRPLPAFSGGSHIVIEMKDGETLRRTPYSLSSSPFETDDYQVSIRRDDEGRGGSRYMHREVEPGMAMSISHPTNLFPLDRRAPKHLMIAGGIGITPFMSQTAQLAWTGGEVELHYGVQNRKLGAYLDELTTRLGNRLHVYLDENGQRPDLDSVLRGQPTGTHLYVCGPGPMIDAVLNRARELAWPEPHLHYELFAKTAPGTPFTATLQESDLTVEVGEQQSLLEAIENAGVDAPYMCRGGVCGQCETRVISYEGELLHDDHWLTDEERAAGEKIMPCVSRCRGTVVLER